MTARTKPPKIGQAEDSEEQKNLMLQAFVYLYKPNSYRFIPTPCSSDSFSFSGRSRGNSSDQVGKLISKVSSIDIADVEKVWSRRRRIMGVEIDNSKKA